MKLGAMKLGIVGVGAMVLAAIGLVGGCGGSAPPVAMRAEAAEAGATAPTHGPSPGSSTAAEREAPSAESDSWRKGHWESISWPQAEPLETVPSWVVDAIFYQIFPERFRNGDPANDPTRESLEFPEQVSESWAPTPWTSDWYARADWERARGDNFYEHGVFDRRYGGDLQGVLDKLDYLQELGVNTLYFNPVFFGRSLHKYDGASMHHIDPYFGPDPAGDLALMAEETSDPATWKWTSADKLFLRLIEELHERQMRILIDGVFNHTGRDFFAFANLREQQEASPYQSWYIVQHFDDPETPNNEFRYKGWWGIDTLPEFANNPAGDDLHDGPKDYVLAITRRWMDPNGDGSPEDGIDGWRLDVANEVPMKFWQQWHRLVRALNPDAYTVAEVWDDARDFLLGCGFSATMNYHAFSYPVKGFLIDGQLSAHDFGHELLVRSAAYPPAMRFGLQNLVDGHDTDRVASMIVNRNQGKYLQADRFDFDVGERVSPRWYAAYKVQAPTAEDRRIQRIVALMQMTYIGGPMLYYGTEAGMWGGDDPCDRMPMVWDDLEYEPQAAHPLGAAREPDNVAFDDDLFAFYRAAIALRRQQETLRRGGVSLVEYVDDKRWFVFERTLGEERLVIAINRGLEPYRWTPPASPTSTGGRLIFTTQPGAEGSYAPGEKDPPTAARASAAELVVPPLCGIVWKP